MQKQLHIKILRKQRSALGSSTWPYTSSQHITGKGKCQLLNSFWATNRTKQLKYCSYFDHNNTIKAVSNLAFAFSGGVIYAERLDTY